MQTFIRLVLGLIVFSFFVVLLVYVVVKIQLNKRHVMKSTNSNMEHTILENDRRASTVSQLWLPPSARLPSARPSITDSTCNILAAEERRRSSTSVWLPYSTYSPSTSLPVGNSASTSDQHRRPSNVTLSFTRVWADSFVAHVPIQSLLEILSRCLEHQLKPAESYLEILHDSLAFNAAFC